MDHDSNTAQETDASFASWLLAASWDTSESCANCISRSICLPAPLTVSEYSQFERVVRSQIIQRRGDVLYRQHAPCQSIFAIHTGSVMLTSDSDQGVEQILGFHFPGNVIGFDGIVAGVYTSSARVMEPTTICEIPFDALHKLGNSIPNLQSRLFRMMSSQIIDDHKLQRLLSKGQAAQRVAAFLLAMSEIYRKRGQSATRFTLPMARSDIATYLGLTIETINHCFSELTHLGALTVSCNDIASLDVAALQRTVDGLD